MRDFYVLCLSFVFFVSNIVFGKEINIDNISQKPIFSNIVYWNPIGSKEICEILSPILKEHLKNTSYNRLSLTLQYIHYYDTMHEKDPLANSLEILESFVPDLSLGDLNGSSCFGLNIDLLSKIPSPLSAYPIPATLFSFSQQPYWPILSHIALIIPFYNPEIPEDKGYILLDPHLKIESPIVITLSGEPQIKDLKEKGSCTFFYEKGKIISSSLTGPTQPSYSMTYYLTEFTNFAEAGVKPILAADRKITIYSRTEEGIPIASLILLLDTDTLRYKLQDSPIEELSFADFLSHKILLKDSLADALHIEKKKLCALIEEILLHKNLLDDLYHKYTEFIDTNSRIDDFYVPSLKTS